MTPTASSGFFITLEGGEGAGKSTHAVLLAERLKSLGRAVVVTREPGGSPEAEKLRQLLLGGATCRWSPLAEALLNYAARDTHMKAVVRPALGRGAVVISDRFMDSTTVYQGYAGGVDFQLLQDLERAVVGNERPQLTIVFDIDPALGLERARKRDPGTSDRFEGRALEFHRRLREGFLDLARRESERCVVVDATRPKEIVSAEIWETVAARIGA